MTLLLSTSSTQATNAANSRASRGLRKSYQVRIAIASPKSHRRWRTLRQTAMQRIPASSNSWNSRFYIVHQWCSPWSTQDQGHVIWGSGCTAGCSLPPTGLAPAGMLSKLFTPPLFCIPVREKLGIESLFLHAELGLTCSEAIALVLLCLSRFIYLPSSFALTLVWAFRCWKATLRCEAGNAVSNRGRIVAVYRR
ncbi:hypothetical protein GE09DRAFT_599903 [Coniochaeta sp. 2T2.1]|nr:hypothetical protein GE09DRAFT_599903 [Coniochaeta sp. 2T2.1]